MRACSQAGFVYRVFATRDSRCIVGPVDGDGQGGGTAVAVLVLHGVGESILESFAVIKGLNRRLAVVEGVTVAAVGKQGERAIVACKGNAIRNHGNRGAVAADCAGAHRGDRQPGIGSGVIIRQHITAGRGCRIFCNCIGVRIGHRGIVGEKQLGGDVEAVGCLVAIAIRCRGGQGDEVGFRQGNVLVRIGGGMLDRANLVECHIARAIYADGEDHKTGLSSHIAFDLTSVCTRAHPQQDILTSGRIVQAGICAVRDVQGVGQRLQAIRTGIDCELATEVQRGVGC